MSDFGKKLLGLGVAAGLLFLLMAFITWCNVNQYDEGEFVMNIAQTAAGVASMVFLAQLKAFFGLLVLLALALGSASEAQAGPLGRLFGGRLQRSCATCGVRAPVQAKAKPQYRVECRGGVCRRVEVK